LVACGAVAKQGFEKGTQQAAADATSATQLVAIPGIAGDAVVSGVLEPPLPGVKPGQKKAKIVLAVDVDWPPYAFFKEGTAGETGGLSGFGKDVAEGVGAVCDYEVTMVQTNWANCWDANGYKKDSPGIGKGLLDGYFHGCSTYTHAQGVRNRFMEFSDAILDSNKPAGLLTLLVNGQPKLDGLSDLAGKRVVDVGGWVPTADGLGYVLNQCTGKQYAQRCKVTNCTDGYTLLVGNGNDAAMQMLRDGEADAMFVYADQAYNYECDANGRTHSGAIPTWDCALWKGFGTEYAYVQSGQFGHALNGTTLSISKKGSGLPDMLNPCIQKFMQTKEYYDVCAKHGFEASCYTNSFFPAGSAKVKEYMKPTSAHSPGCASGYCGCPAGSVTTPAPTRKLGDPVTAPPAVVVPAPPALPVVPAPPALPAVPSKPVTCAPNFEPALPGVKPGTDRPKIVLATDVDWPPYAFFTPGAAGTSGGLSGFGKDVAQGVGKVCDYDITMVQTNWKNCWDANGYKQGSPGIGKGLQDGWFNGCSTYTHAQGVRNRFMEFSDAILDSNKPAGLLTLLDANGNPKVDGLSDLSGKRVVDVGGWVPTADGLMFVVNKCTGKQYAGKCSQAGGTDCYTLLVGDGNDAAMKMLRDGQADAMFVYADQAYNYECDANGKTHSGASPTWDCSLWAGFGTQYAYVQSGQMGHAMNGTTLSISKKGSGLADMINPCIQKFMQTKEYYDVCVKHGMDASCYKNSFFPTKAAKVKPYMKPTNQHSPGCATGYCGCPAPGPR